MNDLIDRQDAISALERKKDKNVKGDIGGFYNKIIQNDIDALMQLPSAQPDVPDTNVGDIISRQAAIKALIHHITPHDNGDGSVTIGVLSKSSIKDILNKLPSV